MAARAMCRARRVPRAPPRAARTPLTTVARVCAAPAAGEFALDYEDIAVRGMMVMDAGEVTWPWQPPAPPPPKPKPKSAHADGPVKPTDEEVRRPRATHAIARTRRPERRAGASARSARCTALSRSAHVGCRAARALRR